MFIVKFKKKIKAESIASVSLRPCHPERSRNPSLRGSNELASFGVRAMAVDEESINGLKCS